MKMRPMRPYGAAGDTIPLKVDNPHYDDMAATWGTERAEAQHITITLITSHVKICNT